MQVDFSTEIPETSCDFILSECDSMHDVLTDIESIVGDANHIDRITVSIRRPLPPQVALPQVFKAIVETVGASDKALSLFVYVDSEEVKDNLYRLLPAEQAFATTFQLSAITLTVRSGDLTTMQVEAIVNASNTRLQLGGGVSGAIRRAARASLQDELDRIVASRSLVPGDAVITGAHGIPGIDHIIHTATASGFETNVQQSIRNVLAFCDSEAIRSVAFPALGTGVGRLSMERFARLFLDGVMTYLDVRQSQHLHDIRLVLLTQRDYDTCVACFRQGIGD